MVMRLMTRELVMMINIDYGDDEDEILIMVMLMVRY